MRSSLFPSIVVRRSLVLFQLEYFSVVLMQLKFFCAVIICLALRYLFVTDDDRSLFSVHFSTFMCYCVVYTLPFTYSLLKFVFFSSLFFFSMFILLKPSVHSAIYLPFRSCRFFGILYVYYISRSKPVSDVLHFPAALNLYLRSLSMRLNALLRLQLSHSLFYAALLRSPSVYHWHRRTNNAPHTNVFD